MSPRFAPRYLPDGRALVNLGSSTRVAPGWNNVDFSWIIRLGRHPWLCDVLYRTGILTDQRYARIRRMDPDTILWNLKRGIPFADDTFDAVYHCHVLEHIDRDVAPVFLRECRRVLRPGGVLRIVVPDLETLAREYLHALAHHGNGSPPERHSQSIEAIFDQMIVRTPLYRREQKRIVQWLESILIGNTDRAGILHRWMYDRVSLAQLLRDVGFSDVQNTDAVTSWIDGWSSFHLDTEPDGSEYKPGSLYMEARDTVEVRT